MLKFIKTTKPLQDRSLIQSTKDESIHTTMGVTVDSKNSNSKEVSNFFDILTEAGVMHEAVYVYSIWST